MRLLLFRLIRLFDDSLSVSYLLQSLLPELSVAVTPSQSDICTVPSAMKVWLPSVAR